MIMCNLQEQTEYATQTLVTDKSKTIRYCSPPTANHTTIYQQQQNGIITMTPTMMYW